MRCVLLVMAAALVLTGCGRSSTDDAMAAAEGEAIYNTNCATCHGRTGDLGIGGAKNLRASTLTHEEVITRITIGKGAMMPYGTILTKKEIDAVSEHVLALREKK